MEKWPKYLRTACVAAAALTLALFPALGTTAANAATAPRIFYQGAAYGTYVNVGPVVTSGPSALVAIGCTDQSGIRRSNTTAGVNLSPLLTSGTVATTAGTFVSPTQARTTATTQQVSLLSGLIHAGAVNAASATAHTSAGFAVSAQGTSLVNLVVAGVSVTSTPAPNTKINLAGIGYVVLNEQRRSVTSTAASLSVNAIHVVVTTTNTLGIAVNTNVVVSHADSGLGGPVIGVLDGFSYGSSVTVGTLVRSGPTFPAYMPCLGTGGVLRSNTGAGITVANTLVTGTITDTVQGTTTATFASGETTSTVQSASLLGGIVTATGIKADAHAFTNGSTFSFTDTGSSFVTLKLLGLPLNINVAPNTTVNVPGVGTLYLHRVLRTSNSIEVRMIELVTTSVVNGLPIGTDVQVAVAEASAH